ncbi:MAG TPA: uracil phosphoribosyltransferase [Thermomicrobiales bacterium]|nr:uracil phosphoribosyltransferase [Thermomicrobiales bacterium]
MSEQSHPEVSRRFPNLFVSHHPLVQHKITQLSEARTATATFRQLTEELTHFLVYEATTDLPLKQEIFDTPLEQTQGSVLDCRIALVPIMRAGLGMVDSARDLVPHATVYHLGLYRDEVTHLPISYYRKLPDVLPNDVTIVLDPMLATAGSATAAVSELKAHGAKWIKYVGLIAAPEGVELMLQQHPDVPIHVARLDRELDGNKFIRPGLGDAGDRMFGTVDV